MNVKTTCFLLAILCSIFSLQAQDKSQQIAQKWLDRHLTTNKLRSNAELKLYFRHEGPAGETLRYRQYSNGVPVMGAEIAIHVSPNNKVTYHSSTLDAEVRSINTTPAIKPKDAMDIAKRKLNTLGTTGSSTYCEYFMNSFHR